MAQDCVAAVCLVCLHPGTAEDHLESICFCAARCHKRCFCKYLARSHTKNRCPVCKAALTPKFLVKVYNGIYQLRLRKNKRAEELHLDRLNLASAYLSNDHPESALDLLNEILEDAAVDDTTRMVAGVEAGNALRMLARPGEAYLRLRDVFRALIRTPDGLCAPLVYTQCCLSLGQLHMGMGHIEDAKSEFESALGVCSELPRDMVLDCMPTVKIMENVAECYKREGNPDRQERCLRIIAETLQRNEPDVYLRARSSVELARVQIERLTANATTSKKLIESIKGLRSRHKDPRAG